MSKPVLTYFDARGRAEIARLIFAEAGVEYEDKRLSREEFAALKPNLPFGQVPVLEWQGNTITQSYTIFRFLARQFGLYGKSDIEGAKADMIVDAVIDIANAVMGAKTDEEKQKLWSETMPRHLGNLEKILKANGGEYFTGSFTYADIVMMNRWYSLSTDYASHLEAFPLLKAHYERISSRPGIAAWIKKRPVNSF